MAKSKSGSNAKGQSKIAMAALSTVPLLMVLGNSMLIPEFPKIQSALHISQFQVGLLITLFSAAAGITIPILGFLSDQYGRKTIIIPAVLLYGIGGVISGLGATILGPSYFIVLIGRVVQGIGAAGTAPIVMAMVGDLYKSNARSEAMGIIEASNGMGKVLSPILGTAIALIAWWALFFSYSILAVPIAAAIYFLTQEPENKGEKQKPGEYFKSILEIFKQKGAAILVSLFAGMVILFNLFGVLSIVSDILENTHHLKGLVKGLVIAIPIFFMSSFAYLTGFFLKKKGKYFKIAILTGLITASVSLALLPFFKNPYIYIAILSIMGLGSGFVLPSVNTLITSSAQSQQRGGVTSIYGAVRFLGVAIGPPIFSLLFKVSEKVMFWTAAATILVAAGLVLAFLKEQKLLGGQGGQKQGEKDKSPEKHSNVIVKGLPNEEPSIFKPKNPLHRD